MTNYENIENISKIIEALMTIRDVCKDHPVCIECPFYTNKCNIKAMDAEEWDINSIISGGLLNE